MNLEFICKIHTHKTNGEREKTKTKQCKNWRNYRYVIKLHHLVIFLEQLYPFKRYFEQALTQTYKVITDITKNNITSFNLFKLFTYVHTVDIV